VAILEINLLYETPARNAKPFLKAMLVSEPLLQVQGVTKTYQRDGQPDHLALAGIDCQLNRGEVLVVVGPSRW